MLRLRFNRLWSSFDPNAAVDTLRKAAAAHLKGDLLVAQSLYSQALEENPEDGDAWQMLAVLHFDRLEIADAERCNSRALALDPDSGAAHNTDGNILKSQDRLREAAKSYERATMPKEN